MFEKGYIKSRRAWSAPEKHPNCRGSPGSTDFCKALEKLHAAINTVYFISNPETQIIDFCFYFPERLSDFSN